MVLGHCRGVWCQRPFAAGRHRLRQAEVKDLCLSALGDKKIGRFEIAVDDARPVRYVERIGNLLAQQHHLLDWQWFTLNRVLEGPALHPFHHDEGLPVVDPDVIHGADVRMVEGRGRAGFALEAIQSIRRGRGVFWQELQSDAAAELRVFRFVDDTHSPAAKLRQNLVA